MKDIAFIDTEIDPNNGRIVDIGSIRDNGSIFHSNSITGFVGFLNRIKFICGHNIVNHDLKFIEKPLADAKINPANIIDTLYLSPLLFPARPYHALVKDDKLQTEDLNNPLNDAIKAKDLFYDEVAAFQSLDESLKSIYCLLLNDKDGFKAFFHCLSYQSNSNNTERLIRDKFHSEICEQADLAKIISSHPIELAYCLALINCRNRYSITPPWVLKSYPEVDRIMHLLRSKPCLTGCAYCDGALDIFKGLKRFFGFESFRTYAGEPLQEKAVRAAVENRSILAIFPTGGGKSITFQIPALMAGEAAKGLTVVISPLQSLMKDQVDNLEKVGITDAVTINGLLDPIERAKSFERVEDGSASILYISPESLRSRTIERLLLARKIARFVIDEAHCFSSWGQDFRVDYLYIGDFIKNLQVKKNLHETIPISCFTATAKQKVIEDIRDYFMEKLSVKLELFRSTSTRTNLRYKVFEKGNEEDKYNTARDLIEEKNCPTIIYVSRTRKAYLLAERLTEDGFNARPYHGKMDIKEKSENQNAFISGDVQIMVATSAFGMGVDKKDVGMVIHYEISDSLENYIQEAGRAGRDESIIADCYVLFNEEDLDKHFILHNQTKLGIKEIQQVWKAIKGITKYRLSVSNSALEIARKSGWDDSVADIETRVTTAIAALENAGYLKRGQNEPRVFANSILSKSAQEAIDKINSSGIFEEHEKVKAIRIIKKLFSSKSRKHSNDESAESRVDYISDHLGIVKEEVIKIITLLRQEKILAKTKDLTAFIKKSENINRSLAIVQLFSKIENFLFAFLEEKEKVFHLKELNELAEESGLMDVSPARIKTIINFWAIKNWIKRHNENFSNHHIRILCLHDKASLKKKLEKRHSLASFIIEYLYRKTHGDAKSDKGEAFVEFSVHELKDAFEQRLQLFETNASLEDIEDSLFYLSRIEAIKIEGGFLVVYNKLTIERIEQDNKRRYKTEDYQQLSQFYENKIQQIHIVGEYAKKMISDYKSALKFVDDYFILNYASFLIKYFPGSRQNEIKQNLTPAKFKQLFGALSPRQLDIIKDNQNKYIVVAAGPGSGKTRILVHKMASLLLMEDVKHEQLLMVTFSRAAAGEFKKRLLALIGNAANFVEIKTFHSCCFDLMGKVGTLEKSDEIIRMTIDKIRKGEVEVSKITKTVLLIDEAQDMDADEFALVNILIEQNEDMRVIAVGDDDQNIYEFRGSSAKYLEKFMNERNAIKYELVENYRSRSNLVEFSNSFARGIRHRLKSTPVVAIYRNDGKIKVARYNNQNLISPLVNDILSTDLSGSTCILTKTNEEALQIRGLLLKNSMPAKLIQTNESFDLYNLLEVRFFINQVKTSDDVYVISDDDWEKAKRELKKRFEDSSMLEICLNIIKEFELTNPGKKYRSDFEVMIRESQLEDFLSGNGETIIVSTMHKAKGREFDNVFIMLENYHLGSDESRRLIYVAMTRAKQSLAIHLNGNYLDHINVFGLERIENRENFPPPTHLVIQLTHKDVWLDYFINKQYHVSQLLSGELLNVKENDILNHKGVSVLKFSMEFNAQVIDQLKTKGYILKGAKVNFILYWQKKEADREIKIVLPELWFERNMSVPQGSS
jgi:ATP-dependent DNA helicase RecQ